MTIDFNPRALNLNDKPSRGLPERAIFDELEVGITYTFSGKTSIALLLRYYQSTGAFRDRTDQIMVPHWLGTPVYEGMHKYCFPTTTYNDKVRGVMAYHQWGYPQNIEAIKTFCDSKNLFFIEDCAHAFESYYHGKRVGTFGGAAVFSLAKFFPSVVGGAIYTDSTDLHTFILEARKRNDEKLAREMFDNRFAYDVSPTEHNGVQLARDYIVYERAIVCPPFVLAAVRQSLAADAVERRKKYHELYAEAFGDEPLLASLLREKVMPWVIPMFAGEKCDRVAAALQAQGVQTAVYHFDVNRNMLDPNFVRCVPLPCHQDIGEDDVRAIITAIKKVL